MAANTQIAEKESHIDGKEVKVLTNAENNLEQDETEVYNVHQLVSLLDGKPTLTIYVNGKKLQVLCDTGACKTVLKAEPPRTTFSREVVMVKTASGHVKTQPLTMPLTFLHKPSQRSCNMPCIIDPTCPVNLLGRDAMTKLGIGVIPTETGMTAEIMLVEGDPYQREGKGEPNYYWSLDLPPLMQLKEAAEKHLPASAEKMKPTEYHNTLRYKQTPGPDPLYDKQVHSLKSPYLTLQHLYVTKSGNAVCSVIQRDQIKNLNRITKPHVSVAKTTSTQWNQLGDILQKVENDKYTPTEEEGWAQGKRTGCMRYTLGWVVKTTPNTHLYDSTQK